MKKYKVIIFIIAIWQFLWAIFALCILVIRIKDSGFWSDPTLGLHMESDMGIVIGWRVVSIFSTVFPLVAVIGCVGLIMRSNWGRRLSILSMGITAFLVLVIVVLVFSSQNELSIDNVFTEVIPPILLMLVLLLSGILSLLYLLKPRVKELFERKSVQALN